MHSKNKTGRLQDQLLTEGVIWKQLVFFSIPIMVGTLFQQLYNMIDAIVVGNFVGITALAAVGDTRKPLYYLIVCCALNTVLDLLLVVVFELGIFGVARYSHGDAGAHVQFSKYHHTNGLESSWHGYGCSMGGGLKNRCIVLDGIDGIWNCHNHLYGTKLRG